MNVQGLTRKDRQSHVKRLLLDPVNFAKSDRVFAAEVGLGRSAVRRYRGELIPLIEDPSNPLGLDSDVRGELLKLIRPRAGVSGAEEEPKMRFSAKAELPFDVPPADEVILASAVRMLLEQYRMQFGGLDSSESCQWSEEETYSACVSSLGGLPESMVYRVTLAKAELYRSFLSALP